uniref:Uncharacterized protein n=1 Tax=Anguilla anguilla TaxID=7936 RepID=A0A0E9UP11_ANGAN
MGLLVILTDLEPSPCLVPSHYTPLYFYFIMTLAYQCILIG